MNKKELKSIFLKIKKDDKKGIEELYSKYHKMVYGIAFSILKNKEDAEDIMQIVFAKIQELDKTKLPEDKEMTWLYTLTKNETLNYLKKKKEELSLDTIYEIENKNNEIDEKIDYIEFNRLIRKLNKKEQEIISLKIISNFSFQEISELLNEPVGTVKWRYYKSLRSLKAMLGSLAMFVMTFTIGIKALFTNRKTGEKQQEAVQSEDNLNMTETEKTQNTVRQDSDNMNNGEFENQEQHKEMQDIIQEEIETQDKNEKENDNKVAENITEQNSTTENTIEETEIKDETISNTITQENQIKQETIVNEESTENEISYRGIGFIGISVIFFIMTIIFFIKYQLKTKKKLSK